MGGKMGGVSHLSKCPFKQVLPICPSSTYITHTPTTVLKKFLKELNFDLRERLKQFSALTVLGQ